MGLLRGVDGNNNGTRHALVVLADFEQMQAIGLKMPEYSAQARGNTATSMLEVKAVEADAHGSSPVALTLVLDTRVISQAVL